MRHLALPLACVAALGAQDTRPDIVLIQLDDWGYHAVGAHGAAIPTPHIDQLISEGMDCTAAHTMPLCSPTRLQLLTGLSGLRNYTKFGQGAPGARTFAMDLKAAGYDTALVGKWHTGGAGCSPSDYGFQFVRLAPNSAHSYNFTAPSWLTTPLPPGTYQPDLLQDQAMAYLRTSRTKPALLYYALRLPHYPWNPPPGVGDPNADDPKYCAAMITYADKLVGAIAHELRTSGRAANTLVLVTGDNGCDRKVQVTMKNGKKIAGQKGTLRDGATHVPLIAWWPGRIAAGSTCPDLIDCADLYPTVCEVAGVAHPSNLDAVSFAPRLFGQPGQPRSWIYGWFDGKEVYHSRGEWARDHQWKLLATGELYDVIADPLQMKPVPPSPAADAARAKLQAVLNAMPNRAWGAPPTGVPTGPGPGPQPSVWTSGDLGAVGAPGSTTNANGTFTVSGSGADIWGTRDEFRFVSQPFTGDGMVSARVVSQTNTNPWAKAGVMIRASTNAQAPYAMTVATPGNGISFQRRLVFAGTSTHTAGSKSLPPRWLRIERSGGTMRGRESADGAAWTLIGTATMTMPTDVLVGLCVTSHADGVLSTAVFTNVSVVPTAGG